MLAARPMSPKSQRKGGNGRSIAKKAGGYHHGDLRRALLDATLALIEEKGPEGFTLRAAAKLAGVSDAAPYHHFADKEALLAAVAEEGFRRLHGEMKQAAEDGTAKTPKELSRDMGVAYVLFAAQNPSHFRVMSSRMVLHQTNHPSLATAAAEAFTYVESKLMESLTEEESRLPPEYVHFGSWGLVHGLAFLAIDGQLGALARDPKKLRDLVRGAMAVLSGPPR